MRWMMRMSCLLLLLALSGARASSGQTPARAVVAGMEFFYRANRTNVLKAAEMIPAERYAFRPADTVRTVGQLFAHIADTQYFACAKVRGVPNPNEREHRPGVVANDGLEAHLHTKAEIVQALTASFTYCDETFSRATDARLAETDGETPVSMFATLAVYHTGEHYGNVVTYMRMIGLVPPSSGGATSARPSAPDAR